MGEQMAVSHFGCTNILNKLQGWTKLITTLIQNMNNLLTTKFSFKIAKQDMTTWGQQCTKSHTPAFIWLWGGRGFSRCWPTVRPKGESACFSRTSGLSWKPLPSSKMSAGGKVRGDSFRRPWRRARQPSNRPSRASVERCVGAQKICGARTWKPQ